jgi:hypothetical protein
MCVTVNGAYRQCMGLAKGSVESTHKGRQGTDQPEPLPYTKHCHAVVASLGGLVFSRTIEGIILVTRGIVEGSGEIGFGMPLT